VVVETSVEGSDTAAEVRMSMSMMGIMEISTKVEAMVMKIQSLWLGHIQGRISTTAMG